MLGGLPHVEQHGGRPLAAELKAAGIGEVDMVASLTQTSQHYAQIIESLKPQGKIGVIDADPRWRKPFDVVDALARAILYQQLAGKAAATIVGRVEVAVGATKLHAAALDRIDDGPVLTH